MSRYYRRKRRITDMNVVPYIDVMLVLLIIFMITSPLLTESVEVQLPTVNLGSKPILSEEGKIVLFTINHQGDIFKQNDETPITSYELENYIERLKKHENFAELQFIFKGDVNASYGKITEFMAYLKSKGIQNVGLLTKVQ